MIPDHMIERARATRLESVIERRGIKLHGQAKHRANQYGPCPACGGVDRFSINTKKRLFFCRGCGAKGDAIALVRFLDGVDFRTAVETLCGSPINIRQRPTRTGEPYIIGDTAEAAPRLSQSDEDAKRDLASAARIISGMRPLIGTPGAYLRDVRKIDVQAIEDVLSRTDAVGWHPAVYFNEPGHPLHGQRLGCIVGIMTDPITAHPTGAISRTYLDQNLTKTGKAKTLGAPMGIVRLSPDDEVLGGLVLAEGIETALAGMSIGLRPMWSTGTCGLMASFPVLSGIEALTVIVDHDLSGAGERAAREVEARWLTAGREVNLLRSNAPGDLNDALKGTSS